MRLVTFSRSGEDAGRVGLLVESDARVVDLAAATGESLRADGAEAPQAARIAEAMFADMVTFIGCGEWGKARAREVADAAVAAGSDAVLDASAVQLRAPLLPTRLRDCIAFETHLRNFYENLNGKEVPPAFYRIPTYYKGNANTIFGPDDEITWPGYATKWDYELELGVVIGRSGVDIAVDEAESHIYGLTCFNDWTDRGILKDEIEIGLGPNKGKDFATSLGPVLVTMDEIDDLYDLTMEARINGETWSSGNTREIHWKFSEIIERMSDSEPMITGEVFGSGTVANGCGLELGKYLKPGDVVEIEIGGIGILRNTVTGVLAPDAEAVAATTR